MIASQRDKLAAAVLARRPVHAGVARGPLRVGPCACDIPAGGLVTKWCNLRAPSKEGAMHKAGVPNA
jgi:hypothetical protein